MNTANVPTIWSCGLVGRRYPFSAGWPVLCCLILLTPKTD